MALDTTPLAAAIKQALLDQRSNTQDPEGAATDLANKIAAAVVNCVKGIEITYTSGLTAPNGPVTGTFGNTIS